MSRPGSRSKDRRESAVMGYGATGNQQVSLAFAYVIVWARAHP